MKNKNNRDKDKKKVNIFKLDENIPRLTFISSILLFISICIVTMVFPIILSKITDRYRILLVILGSILIGMTLPVSEYFIEKKKKVDKRFYIKSGLLMLLSLFILTLAYFGDYLI